MAAEITTPSPPDTAQQNQRRMGNKGEISQNAHNGCVEELPPPPCVSTECPKCQGNLPLATAYTDLCLLPFLRRSSSPIPSLDLKSGSILRLHLPVPTRLFLTLIKTHQLCFVFIENPCSLQHPHSMEGALPPSPGAHLATVPGHCLGTVFPSLSMEQGSH